MSSTQIDDLKKLCKEFEQKTKSMPTNITLNFDEWTRLMNEIDDYSILKREFPNIVIQSICRVSHFVPEGIVMVVATQLDKNRQPYPILAILEWKDIDRWRAKFGG